MYQGKYFMEQGIFTRDASILNFEAVAAGKGSSARRFIKGGFQDYEGLGVKRSAAEPPYDRGCQETTSFGFSPKI
jgi:hypothetical protein